jgi:hypothetical protein
MDSTEAIFTGSLPLNALGATLLPGRRLNRKLSGCWRSHGAIALQSFGEGEFNEQFIPSRSVVKEGTRSVGH